ncbi:hypothetical protein APR41_02145 [Salegentibacter salinarum]|uniref:Helix-turn-helix type 11 domain-containing protein n=2 Tax=Salegentibacter salinarum TaxID=447422 RepID=A0A2N0U466_9FLAO|nr:hypothetical protein APR41_02145 [Salegentibacter salinarum]
MEKSKEKIRNKGRVEGTLKLIKFLNDYRTIAECANHVDIHRKSVHRYFNLLTQLGFEIEILVKYRHKYRIINLKEYFQDGNEM